jgi:hypothetical protein
MGDERDFSETDTQRASDREAGEGPGGRTENAGTAARGPVNDGFPAALNFSTFILSLTTSMLVSLGDLPDPVTNVKGINLSLAKQTISIIEMLREKTVGNLTSEEEHLIDTVLFDLRMKYVSAAAKRQ